MGERFFFRFQILLSHNNHLTAPRGLAAASDVEVERERGGGGGGGSCGWTVTNPVHYNSTHSWISQNSSPLCLIGPSQSARTRTYAFHLSIPGPNLGQVLLNIPGNILTEKAKHKLEGKLQTMQVFKGTLSKLSNTYLLAH